MADYTYDEARDWAKENLRGVAGCLLPTLNSSLTAVNERAIRHDVRLEAEYGFWGTLLVTETGTTDQEMREVIDIATHEAAQVGLRTIILASAPTLQATIDLVKDAEASGADLVLLSYPLTFYPETEQDVYEFTKAVADATGLGLILFAMGLWNFNRLHPSGFSPALMARLIEDCPNIVGIKNEIGGPGVGGIAEVFHRFSDVVVVTDPVERNCPAWVQSYGMRFMATSNYELHGPLVPRYFDLLQDGKWDEAMEIYWQIHPARVANGKISAQYMPGAQLVHRLIWKYEYWLNGFNGGPIRQPHMRINDSQMRALRAGVAATGVEVPDEPDSAFFVGRNPME